MDSLESEPADLTPQPQFRQLSVPDWVLDDVAASHLILSPSLRRASVLSEPDLPPAGSVGVRAIAETESQEEAASSPAGSAARLAAMGLAAGLLVRGSGLMGARKIRSRGLSTGRKSLDLRLGGKTR